MIPDYSKAFLLTQSGHLKSWSRIWRPVGLLRKQRLIAGVSDRFPEYLGTWSRISSAVWALEPDN
jgi:hypothetical protein